MTTPEGALKKQFIEELESRGACCIPVPGGTYGRPGSPDHIVCYKGYFIGLEGKTYRGVQSEDQKEIEADIKSAGGIYILGKHWNHVWGVLNEIDEKERTC
jgi:hypothetical protein